MLQLSFLLRLPRPTQTQWLWTRQRKNVQRSSAVATLVRGVPGVQNQRPSQERAGRSHAMIAAQLLNQASVAQSLHAHHRLGIEISCPSRLDLTRYRRRHLRREVSLNVLPQDWEHFLVHRLLVLHQRTQQCLDPSRIERLQLPRCFHAETRLIAMLR